MPRSAGWVALALLLLWSPSPICAESNFSPSTPANAPAPAKAAAGEDDPWGRTTPWGTVVGFMRAMIDQDYARAGGYLETRLVGEERDALARQLNAVLNRLPGTLDEVSRNPEGDLADGLPAPLERVGTVESGGEKIELLLKRIQRPTPPPVWLFSAETLRRIPSFYDHLKTDGAETSFPLALDRTRVLALPLLGWLALIAIPISWVLATLVLGVSVRLARPLIVRLGRTQDIPLMIPLGMPLRLLMLAAILRVFPIVGWWLTSREFLHIVSSVIIILGLAWFLVALVTIITEWRNEQLERTGQAGMATVVRMVSRLTKAGVAVSAFLALLYMAGVNLTAVLAGLGVGGLAVAFAAQRTLENLFGGLLVISDHRIRVGDYCKAGAYQGTIEDISLPSTRIRTSNRTVVFVPNSQMAGFSLENFSFRDKFWFCHTVRVRGETSGDQMRYVLAEMRRVLEEDPKVEPKSSHARLIGVKDGMWEIEVATYLMTGQDEEFLELQEGLLLELLDVIEGSGTAVVKSAEMVCPAPDPGLGTDKRHPTGSTLQAWSEQGGRSSSNILQ